MKKILCLFLALLLLCGCTPQTEQRGFTAPSAETTQPTEPAPTEPEWTPYTGKSRNYVHYYSQGRDREWEEDVLYVAGVFLGDVFLQGHPLLTEGKFRTSFALSGIPGESKTHYDAQLREEFLAQINDLIPQISQLEDYEILLHLQRTVAMLGDLHSSLQTMDEYTYPLYLTPFQTEDGVAFHVTAIAKDSDHLLFSRLVSINGVPVETILERFRPYVSYENEEAFMVTAASCLLSNEMLTVCGVTEYKEKDTAFLLRSDDGKDTFLVEKTIKYALVNGSTMVGITEKNAGFLTHANQDSYYWWEHLKDKDIIYIRFNQVMEDYYNYNYTTLTDEVRAYIKQLGPGQTVVMDFRYNPGGYFEPTLAVKMASVMNMEQVSKGYVLINQESYSGAIIMPSSICQLAEGALLVGAPGGQPANFYATNHTYDMPNCQLLFSMSDSWWVSDVDDWGEALTPDVIIHQTLEDFIDGKDTVMEAIYAGNLS